MMSKLIIVLLLITATTSAFAQTSSAKNGKKPSAPVTKHGAKIAAANAYECPDCHKKFTLAQAKKEAMQCECCQIKLVAAKPAPASNKKAKGKRS